jgi:hypothetical protein
LIFIIAGAYVYIKKRRARNVVAVDTGNVVTLVNDDVTLGTINSNDQSIPSVEDQSSSTSLNATPWIEEASPTPSNFVAGGGHTSAVSQSLASLPSSSAMNEPVARLTIADHLRKKSMMYNSDAARLKLQQRLKKKCMFIYCS